MPWPPLHLFQPCSIRPPASNPSKGSSAIGSFCQHSPPHRDFPATFTMQVGSREVVRFRGRYYIKNNPLDAFFEELGDQIIDNIPSAPEEYESEHRSKLKTQPHTAHLDILTTRRMARVQASRVRSERTRS